MSKQLPGVEDRSARKVSRRELGRTLLSGLAAGALLPAFSPLHPVYDHLLNGELLDFTDTALASEKHTLAFLSESQFLSLEKIAEAIVPGSSKAQSAAFIDLLLSVDSGSSQQEFKDSLGAFAAAAEQRFHSNIVGLGGAQLNELLQAASKRDPGNYAHFENLKAWTVGAYYSSETGMRELGWTPDRVFSGFPACTQAESHS